MDVYVDTSALAKWYLPEAGADDFEAWIRDAGTPTISSLTIVEMRCLLARRRRSGSIDAGQAARAHALFIDDLDKLYLRVEPVRDEDVRAAARLLGRMDDLALRTLDAIHVAICRAREIGRIATADRTMAAAAGRLSLEVVRF